MTPFSSIEAVVRTEMLPSLVMDNPRLQLWTGWDVRGFCSNIYGDMLAFVVAKYLPTDEWVQQQIMMPRGALEQSSPTQLFDRLDLQLTQAVEMIISYQPHTPGELCRNNFCEECYR